MFGGGAFGDLGKLGRTCSDDGIGQRHRVIGAGHAAVEVDLVETGGDVGFDQHARVGHRFGRRAPLPGIRAEMVAAQDQPFAWEAFLIGQGADVIAVLRRVMPV